MKSHCLMTHEANPKSVEENIIEISKWIDANFEGEEKLKRQELLQKLRKSEFGKFLIINRGLDGYWIDYAIKHPFKNDGGKLSDIDHFIIYDSPIAHATRTRFQNFKEIIQNEMREGNVMASIPCGTMSDLLDLGYSNYYDFQLVGIDLDPTSIKIAKDRAEKLGLGEHCSFSERDAWSLEVVNMFDLIASNGLNFYEKNDERVINLYREFFQALKSGGVLVTSIFTPPPVLSNKSSWMMEKINLKNLLKQKMLFSDVLQAKFQTYRTEEETRLQLEEVGFEGVYFIYDEAHMMPTVVARKPKILGECKQ